MELTPELLLNAYTNGYFPMSQNRHSKKILWYYPEHRGIIPLENFHISKSLKKTLRTTNYTIQTDTHFPDVIKACAETPRQHEKGTWINQTIEELYIELWKMGYAHSVELYDADNNLRGGLYGVSLGGAFFGESMFSTQTNASKICLVYLINILKHAGYSLLDTQYVNNHLMQFGVIEIPREDYLKRLTYALNAPDNPSSRFSTAAGNILNTSLSPISTSS